MMPHNKIMIPLFLFLLLFSTSSIAVGETVVLPPAPEQGIDTFISNAYDYLAGDWPAMSVMLLPSQSWRAFSLVKFALPSTLNTKHIVSAQLQLYAYIVNTGSPSGVTVNVHRVLEPWKESSVWSDFPLLENYPDDPDSQDLFDVNVESSWPATAPGGWMFFDVTDLVKDWISDPSSNYGVLLETPDESGTVWIYTSDMINPPDIDYHPKLIIIKETPAPTIDFHPETLNLKSKGKWVTCYIELEDHDVEDITIDTIAITSIAMNGEEADLVEHIPAEAHPIEVGDYDGDGIPDLMVKFDRESVQQGIADLMVELDRQSVRDAASLVGLEKVRIKIYFETDSDDFKEFDVDSNGFEGFDEVVIIDKGKVHRGDGDR